MDEGRDEGMEEGGWGSVMERQSVTTPLSLPYPSLAPLRRSSHWTSIGWDYGGGASCDYCGSHSREWSTNEKSHSPSILQCMKERRLSMCDSSEFSTSYSTLSPTVVFFQ